MTPYKLYKIAGVLSVVFGIFSAVCLISIKTVPVALLMAVSGFIFSIVNIYLHTKHEIHDRKYPIGYIGMILSSLPVIFLMYFIFSRR